MLLRRFILTLAAATTVSGCVTTSPSTTPEAPTTATTPLTAPIVEDREPFLQSYRNARSIDPCALHSPQDAARLTALVPDSLMPGPSLDQCELRLRRHGDLYPLWSLVSVTGVVLDSAVRGRSQRQTLAGLTVWTTPESGDDDRCTLIVEHDDRSGLALTAQRTTPAKADEACRIARDYLLAVSTLWSRPATRIQRVSAPFLPLGLADPCLPLHALATEHSPSDLRVLPSAPYRCALVGEAGGTPTVILSYGFGVAPALEKTGARRVLTVGRWNGLVDQPSQASATPCEVVLAADPVIHVDLSASDNPASRQLLRAHGRTCDIALRAAEHAVAALP